jgi:hypothetical protein
MNQAEYSQEAAVAPMPSLQRLPAELGSVLTLWPLALVSQQACSAPPHHPPRYLNLFRNRWADQSESAGTKKCVESGATLSNRFWLSPVKPLGARNENPGLSYSSLESSESVRPEGP